ncbi:hypothetical protein PMAYCL1PPCAC_11132, partial [Pristionchus mayeri]
VQQRKSLFILDFTICMFLNLFLLFFNLFLQDFYLLIRCFAQLVVPFLQFLHLIFNLLDGLVVSLQLLFQAYRIFSLFPQLFLQSFHPLLRESVLSSNLLTSLAQLSLGLVEFSLGVI